MLTGFFYGVVAAFFWSLTNIIDKFLTSRHAEDGNVWGIVILSCFFPAGLLPIAHAVTPIATEPINALILMSSGALMVSWIYFYLKALTEDDASVVMTILVLAPFFSLVLSNVILGEWLTPIQLLGGAILMTGSLFVSYKHESGKVNVRLILFAFSACFVMGLMHVLFKSSTAESSFWISVFWRSLGMVVVGVVLVACISSIRDRFHHFLKHYIQRGLTLNTTNETLTLIGDTIFGFAILFAPIALVQTTEAYQPIFIILITFILGQLGFTAIQEVYDKRTLLHRAVGIFCVVIGSVCMVIFT
jgi:uncharacterized membrane protein